MCFERWMHEVDLLCMAWYGMSTQDLPDMCFRDAYEADVEPERFANENLGSLQQLQDLILD